MIVCSCFGTTDREIRDAYGPDGDGKCPAGQGCGNCEPAVQDLIEQSRQTGPGGPSERGTERPQRD